jgi:hypothetical protein
MDISNKTLAIFLVAAIVLSLGGTMLSLNSLNKIGPTGMASTQIGRVNLTILSNSDITLGHQQIEFGIGVVNTSSGCKYANLTQNATNGFFGNCWVNQAQMPNSVVANETNFWSIQNDGNVNITLTATSTQKNWSNFIGNCTVTDEQNWYRFAAFNNATESGISCQGMNTTGWTNFTGAQQDVCNSLDYVDTRDTIAVVLNLSICQSNYPTGYKNDNVTFQSAAA